MNFIIIASFLILMVLINIAIYHNSKIEKKTDAEFWKKEQDANFVRKKPLDDLDYITIPENILNIHPLYNTNEIQSCMDELTSLSEKKIVNFTGISNTDLKLAYGTANIAILSEYDNNYTSLITTLQKLAENLIAINDMQNAVSVLEFAIQAGSDISKTFFLLADIYQESGSPEKIEALIQQAENLHSLMQDTILNSLKQNNYANSQ